MHPLDRVRKYASLALAALLVINASFCFAMTALSLTRAVGGDMDYGWGEVGTFAALTTAFGGGAAFFWWFGKTAGR